MPVIIWWTSVIRDNVVYRLNIRIKFQLQHGTYGNASSGKSRGKSGLKKYIPNLRLLSLPKNIPCIYQFHSTHAYCLMHQGSRKKRYFVSGPTTKRGVGGKGLATRKKDRFWFLEKNSGKMLWPLKKDRFCGFPYPWTSWTNQSRNRIRTVQREFLDKKLKLSRDMASVTSISKTIINIQSIIL